MRLENVEEYQKVVDAEWNILYDKLDRIAASGAKIVLSKLPIGDVATQYFSDREMFCAGRVVEEDLNRCEQRILKTQLSMICSQFQDNEILRWVNPVNSARCE